MLEYLRIKNLALIEDMELEFAPGLNVLTGETGAGKSFILKALGFLTGDKLDADMVRPGEEQAQAEALFATDTDLGDLILRRVLSAESGRSRVFLNDALTSQERVRQLRPTLLVHTSQHGQQRLLSPAYQQRILDEFLPDPALLVDKDRLLAELRAMAAAMEEKRARCRELEDRRDLLEYQKGIIDEVAPQPDEEEELEAKRREMRGHESLKERLDEALSLLAHPDGGLVDGSARLAQQLAAIADIFPDYAEDRVAVEEARHQLADLESRLRRQDLSASPEDSLEAIEARLYKLAQLKRKLGRPLEEIVRMGREIEENLSFLDSSTLDFRQLEKEEQRLAAKLDETLRTLNAARRLAAENLCAALGDELRGLGFNEEVRVEVEFTAHELYPGLSEERARMLWVPNPGLAPQPLDKIASGGELSRFLLAVVGLLTRGDTPCLIFDEVDAGVGGITLGRLGERIRALAEKRQVILITHWPQLARMADRHFSIRKEVKNGQTSTLCTRLAPTDIREELARMAGGGDSGSALADRLLAE